MSSLQTPVTPSEIETAVDHNGPGAAALLAAGIGIFALSLISIAADHIPSFKASMIFYKPTGPLSGVTTSAIVLWLAVWFIFDIRWRRRNVALGQVATISMVLLILGLVLTFPPLVNLF